MKREEKVLPISELEVTVDGLLPRPGRGAKAAYLIMMLLLLLLFAAILM